MVLVKELSRCRIEDMRVFRRVSAVAAWVFRKRRAWRTWDARRSVGVGEEEGEEEEGESGLEGLYLGGLGRGVRSS